MAFLMMTVLVADKPEKKGKGKKGGGNPAMQLMKQLDSASIELTDEQKETVKAKGAALKEKMAEISSAHELTPQVLASLNAAKKSVREAGKKGKEIEEAAIAEAGLTATQAEGVKEIAAARTAMVKEIVGMLTDEQKEKLPKSMKRMMGGGNKGKKKQS